jgi:predicted transposase YdaD
MSELAAIKEMEEAEAKGRVEERTKIAREMLKDGESMEKIMKYSKLTREEVERLQSER